MKTSDLTGPALDWAVAKCEFPSHHLRFVKGSIAAGTREEYTKPRFAWVRGLYTPCSLADAEHLLEVETDSYYCPSVSWGIGGPIIDREDITWSMNMEPEHGNETRFCAFSYRAGSSKAQAGPTKLIAAMRCYVASKLGDEVDIPKELQ